MEVTAANATGITIKASWYEYAQNGSYATNVDGTIKLNTTNIVIAQAQFAGVNTNIGGAAGIKITSFNVADGALRVGDKQVLNFRASAAAQHDTVILSNSTLAQKTVNWNFSGNAMNNGINQLNVFALDQDGNAISGTVGLELNTLVTKNNAATFSFDEGMGQVASLDSRLEDLDRFHDASGRFLVDNPQTITLVQGDGARTSFSHIRVGYAEGYQV